MAKKHRWEVPVYWVAQEPTPRAGGFDMVLTLSWSMPDNRPFRRTTGDLDLWVVESLAYRCGDIARRQAFLAALDLLSDAQA